jgi:regulator of cell morphogenesis and NO signaling
MDGSKVLDVREIDKRFRKKIILELFSELSDGQTLQLISDHSLAPLQILFQKEKQGFFKWRQLEEGPETWRIAIEKVESLNLTINEILKQYPFAINVLEAHGVAYFRTGTYKLSDICQEAKAIYDEIRQAQQLLVNPLRTDRWTISFTIDYIINNHHTYVKEMVPELERLIDHLVNAHASTHPQLPMIRERFAEFKAELEEHMNDEENIVFPSFKKYELSANSERAEKSDELDDSISWMEEDHILAGTSLKSLRNFCNNYVAPADSSPGFKILFEELKKFELDMHFHMHLENNVLFVKVIEALDQQRALRV